MGKSESIFSPEAETVNYGVKGEMSDLRIMMRPGGKKPKQDESKAKPLNSCLSLSLYLKVEIS